MEFAGDLQWVQYGRVSQAGNRTELTALQTTEGTFPAGSMWRVNPIVPRMEAGGRGAGKEVTTYFFLNKMVYE